MKEVHVEVVLGVFAPSPDFKKDPHTLVSETAIGLRLPYAPMLEQESSLQVAARLLKDSAGLEARIEGFGWIDLASIAVADSATRLRDGVRAIAIPYGALVPYSIVQVGKGFKWMSVTECLRREFVDDHKQLLITICQGV